SGGRAVGELHQPAAGASRGGHRESSMPRHANWLVFDDFVPTGTDGTTEAKTMYTGAQHNAQLGKHSSIALHAVADNVTTSTGYLRIDVFHSADGRIWMQRAGGTPDLRVPSSGALSTSQPNTNFYADACMGGTTATGPLLGFVRFKIYFSDAST